MNLLSIVTPVYEREALLLRTIRSVLPQDDPAWEMIVVDDGSRVSPEPAVRAFGDERLRFVRHERNRGVSPARNTGVAAARGEFVLFLDSDDELLPGAVATIRRRVEAVRADADVGRLAFMYEVAGGSSSPEPPLVDGVLDYEGYIRWTASLTGRTDVANCVRRSTFDRLRFADDRTFESLYHLDFARLWRTRTFPDRIGRVHLDAQNRSGAMDAAGIVRHAPDNARMRSDLVARHGEALRRIAPERWRTELRIAGVTNLLAGRRVAGLAHLARLARDQPSLRVAAIAALGAVSPRALASVMAARARR